MASMPESITVPSVASYRSLMFTVRKR